MLRLNQLGEIEETRDLDVHGNAVSKKVIDVESHKTNNITNEVILLDEIRKRELQDLKKRQDQYVKWQNEMAAIENTKKHRREYEKGVLRDQELFKNYNQLRDDYMDAKYSYDKEKKAPKTDKSNHLGWGHIDPSRDYELFEKGFKYGLNEEGNRVISHGHLNTANAVQQEEYLSKEDEIEIRKGLETGIDRRISESDSGGDEMMAGQANAGFGDFWSDLRDDFVKDVKTKADDYLSYDNIKEEAQELIAQQINKGGQVQVQPDGSQIMVMPGGQRYPIPMKSSIDTKTLLIAGGVLTSVVLLAALIKRK